MLWLAQLHGTNGVRTIINDYAERDCTALLAQERCCYLATVVVIVLGTLVIFTFDPCPARRRRSRAAAPVTVSATACHLTDRRTLMQTHQYDVVIVGAGGAGMRAALESGTARPHRRAHQALPDALPHRCGPGRHVRRPGQRRGGQLGVAHLRHRQGRRLPRRPGRRRGDVQGGHRRGPRPREDGPAVQPHARGQDRPAPLRRAHPRPRRGPRAPLLLRRRPHRPHDPADAVPAVREARGGVLQRVLRPRPAA